MEAKLQGTRVSAVEISISRKESFELDSNEEKNQT